MTNIVSSTLTSSGQVDGRQQVHEAHTDLVGVVYAVDYLSGVGDSLSANLASHAAGLGLQLQADEISGNIAQVTAVGSLASPTFVYSTAAQNLAALRAAYQTSTQVQAIMIGDFLSSLTNTQLENIFSMTVQQVTTLRANFLTPAATNAAAIRAAAGS